MKYLIIYFIINIILSEYSYILTGSRIKQTLTLFFGLPVLVSLYFRSIILTYKKILNI